MEMRSILLNPEEGYPFGVIAGPSLFGRDGAPRTLRHQGGGS